MSNKEVRSFNKLRAFIMLALAVSITHYVVSQIVSSWRHQLSATSSVRGSPRTGDYSQTLREQSGVEDELVLLRLQNEQLRSELEMKSYLEAGTKKLWPDLQQQATDQQTEHVVRDSKQGDLSLLQSVSFQPLAQEKFKQFTVANNHGMVIGAEERVVTSSLTCFGMYDEAVASVATTTTGCLIDGSNSGRGCGIHGRCFIGACICDQGYQGPDCLDRDETAINGQTACCSSSSSGGVGVGSEETDFSSDQDSYGGNTVYGACQKHLEKMASIIRHKPRKGVMNEVTSRQGPCGDVIAWADVCRHWSSGSGVAQISNQRWRLAQSFEESTWNLLVRYTLLALGIRKIVYSC